jgi:hypothetical protein
MKKLITLTALIFLSYFAFSQQPLYRYYNSKLKKHFYTVDFTEYGNGRSGWALEGPCCRVYSAADQSRSIVPFFRYFNEKTGDHYYTTRFEEFGRGGNGYHLEGPACYINKFPAPGTVPFFKYYNRFTGDHFYTIDKRELGHGYDGYQLQGIDGFVLPK